MAAGPVDLGWAVIRTGFLTVACCATGTIIGGVYAAAHFAMPLAEVGWIIHVTGTAGLAVGWAIGLAWTHREVFHR